MADESMNRVDRYISLPGRGRRGVMLRSRLYLGSDHVLSVESNGFTENYKRFYFADIQGIVTRRTARWIWSAAILFFLAAAVFSIVLLIPGIEPYRLTLIGALSLLPFAAILLRGPTCICHLVTAVQKEQLPSLIRLRVARKTIGRIRAAVESVQGAMTAEMRETLLTIEDDGMAAGEKTVEPGGETDSFRRDSGVAHFIGFSMLVAFGLMWLAKYSLLAKIGFRALDSQSPVITIFFLPLVFFCIVLALVRQRASNLSVTVRRLCWGSFLWLIACLFFGILPLWFTVTFPFYLIYTIGSVAGCLILGTLGILAILRHRRARKFPLNNPVVPAEEPLS